MNNVIKVKKIGEITDYFREYYQNIETGRYYAKTDFRGDIKWYTTDCNGGEPDCPLRKDLTIEIVE